MLPSFRAFSFVRNAKSNQSASAYPPRWPVLIAAIILGVMVAAAAAGYLASQREDTLCDTERELQNLSLVLANWVDDGFHSVEQLEIGVADWVHSEGIVDPEEFYPRLATRDVHERLRLRIAAVPRVSRLFLVDLAGRNVANTVSFPAPAINSVGRDYFDELLAGAGDTFLSSPLRNKIDGNWSIFISHRVRSPDGHLVGVVAGGIDLAYFENMFARLALGANSPVSLVRRDGTLLARFPHHETAIGTSVAGAQTFKRVLAFSDNGTIRSASPLDGVERIQAVRALEHYPLVVVATRSIDDVLVPWRAEAGRVAVAVLLLEMRSLGSVRTILRRGNRTGDGHDREVVCRTRCLPE